MVGVHPGSKITLTTMNSRIAFRLSEVQRVLNTLCFCKYSLAPPFFIHCNRFVVLSGQETESSALFLDTRKAKIGLPFPGNVSPAPQQKDRHGKCRGGYD